MYHSQLDQSPTFFIIRISRSKILNTHSQARNPRSKRKNGVQRVDWHARSNGQSSRFLGRSAQPATVPLHRSWRNNSFATWIHLYTTALCSPKARNTPYWHTQAWQCSFYDTLNEWEHLESYIGIANHHQSFLRCAKRLGRPFQLIQHPPYRNMWHPADGACNTEFLSEMCEWTCKMYGKRSVNDSDRKTNLACWKRGWREAIRTWAWRKVWDLQCSPVAWRHTAVLPARCSVSTETLDALLCQADSIVGHQGGRRGEGQGRVVTN